MKEVQYVVNIKKTLYHTSFFRFDDDTKVQKHLIYKTLDHFLLRNILYYYET